LKNEATDLLDNKGVATGVRGNEATVRGPVISFSSQFSAKRPPKTLAVDVEEEDEAMVKSRRTDDSVLKTENREQKAEKWGKNDHCFFGSNPIFIDIKGHLGLGFSGRTQKAMMLLKINGLIYGKPPSY